MYEEKGNEGQRSYALIGTHRNHGYQGSKPTVGGFQPDVFPMCSKCGRKHVGTICPGSGNDCFHCKEKGHIKRFCLKLTRNVNAMKVGRPSSTGQLSTMSGTDTSGVDGLIRVMHGDRYSLFSVVDSGATHSLACVKCVNRRKLQTESLPFDLVVYTPTSGLTVVSTFMFQCPIVGKGGAFTVELI
ncbi:hypothetical protein Lal_00037617 [Lupinus albus]|nr:hypothetical protein Lal_00037617 [Lupinus albus]